MRKINPYQALVNPTVLVNEFQGFSLQKDRTMLELDTALLSDGLAQRKEQDTAGWGAQFSGRYPLFLLLTALSPAISHI